MTFSKTTAITLDHSGYTRAVLDLTMRLAEVIFTAGAGAEDATAAMIALTRAYGLKGTDANITHTIITLTQEDPATHESITRSRNVKYRTLDYSKLTATSELIADIIEKPIEVAEARKILATIVSSKPQVPKQWRRIGWSLVGAGAAVLIGGGPTVIIAAFIATWIIDWITSVLDHRQVPLFYQTVVGGAVGPIVAAIVGVIDPTASPSLVVVATIIMLLAGVTTFGAVHDTLSGFYLTGTARLVEALLITAGLVTGVSGSALFLARFGLVLEIDSNPIVTLAVLPVLLVAAVVIVIGFALAVQVPWRAIWVVCVLGALAEFLFVAAMAGGFGLVWGSAASALGVGLLAAVAARMVRTPPLVIMVTALVPLVPGLTLFRGLLKLSEGDINGLLSLLTAAGIAMALAAGALLSQYVVQIVWGPARRLQRRFVGPLMALPVRLGRDATKRI
ncbi:MULTISPECIES: threonine/serine exporter ThrE family protein [unclassified Cryobacterium]|uniref:threonine/serine ThrE exporter family protein n=1 Tax=unclassified Cryobacterium TaxID=2649013 RepID=UPI00106A1DCD|nr:MULTISPECIES: threonine/serine exporter family protein [unclassified Cryobacterium]TFD09657.1 threonine/serine exporter family protein [Cryobacterium sp. TMT1-2-2]TFD10305.1 threonine/serine exporter family protein [Cryobacterium sp. TMT1-66-1]